MIQNVAAEFIVGYSFAQNPELAFARCFLGTFDCD